MLRRLSAFYIGIALPLLCGGALALDLQHSAQVDACATRADVLGLSRVVEIDTANGPLFGRGSNNFLADGEIVLTFDDGPVRSHTRAVLKALADQCTKATFFLVGRMAVAEPGMVREVASAGHTIGTHTFSHAKLSSLSTGKAEEEVEMGLSAVTMALGAPAAPFFRFPYLSPNAAAVAYLKTRDVASFTIDVDSRDFRTRDPEEVQKNVLTQLAGRRKGILLFHDIQPSTARALPALLAELKKRGFKVVHMVPKEPAHTVPEYDMRAAKLLARKLNSAENAPLAPRSLTWQQSQTGEQEELPWRKHSTSAPETTGSTTNENATVPWYQKWLAP